MALNDPRLVRLPNAEAWIEKNAVVAVARQADSYVGDRRPGDTDLKPGETPVTMINFSIRLVDGKSVNFSSPDRAAVGRFLASIGVIWEGQ